MAEQKPEPVCAGEAGATQDTQLLVNVTTEREQKKYPGCSLCPTSHLSPAIGQIYLKAQRLRHQGNVYPEIESRLRKGACRNSSEPMPPREHERGQLR